MTDFLLSRGPGACSSQSWRMPKLAEHIRCWVNLNIRIYHECDNGIENSILGITIWHHKAYQVMTNGDLVVSVLSIPSSHK